jgi:hypothetical protein
MKNTLLTLLLSSTFFLNAQISDLDLLAYYNFDTDTNNQVAGSTQYDLVASGAAPILTATSDCVNGTNCVSFNGTGALVTTDFFNQIQNNPNQSLSISLWVRPGVQQTTQFASYFEFFNSMFLRGINPINGGINTSAFDSSFNLFQDASGLQANSFTHFVMVFDATNQRLRYYKNGVLIEEIVTTSQNIRFLQQTAFFGGGSDASGNFSSQKGFVGNLDEVYVFNRPLFPQEVVGLFNLETPQTLAPISSSNLLAYYSFDTTLLNEAPGATQYNLGVAGVTSQPPTPVAGITGGFIDNNVAFSFNGSSALATDDFGPYYANSASQDISVSMWLNTPNSAGFRSLIEMFASVFLRGFGEYGISTVNGAFNVGPQGSFLGTSQWQHVALVFDSTNRILRLYLNGIEQSSIPTTTSNVIRYNDKTVIGGGTNADGSLSTLKYFTGTLDEVYIFNRVLTPNEVIAFTNKLVPSAPGPTCPAGDVTLSNQTEVDDFVTQYPTCNTIDGNLTITGNVSDISGLTNLTTINGNLNVSSTTVLTALTGLNNVATVNGNVTISANTALTSLNGFSNLANFSGNITINANNNLNDISALANVPYTIVNGLSINNNSNLSTCNLDFVCDLVINIPANASISGNATGCNNLTEVQAACVASNPPCPPGSVTFDTQAQLDAYLLQYPNCDTINGDVLITGGVNNLSGLTSLTTITGNLQFIFPTGIPSLNGLQNLANVNRIILNGLTGISNLNELSNITGVTEIVISNCDALTDITGLSGITIINERLTVFNNNALQNLDGLQNFTNTLSNASIFIENNDTLTDITALDNLSFQNISFVRIRDNSVLANCTSDFVCDYLDNLNANRVADIVNNASGCDSITEVQTACAAIPPTCPTGDVILNSQADVDNFVLQFPNCDIINGNLRLRNGNITDITGLINITQVTGVLDVVDLPLQSLEGLNSLVSVGNRILIFLNPNLESVADLERLESTFEISINQNDNLTEISLPSLQNIPNGIFIDENASLNSIAGLSNLSNGNIGPISITENPVLENLNGLENVQSVTNMFIWANTNLNDISAIANIPYLNVGVLTIADNTSLSVCANALVCDMIVNNRNISIFGNASGCSDFLEVSNSCSTLSTDQFEQTEMKTYPNPFTDAINIQLPLGVDKASVKIMNIEGKVVYATELNSNQSTINELQTLSKGVYLMQLTFNSGQVSTYKIIK